MASGDAQFWTHQFVDADGVPYAGVKVYRYGSGTSTLKDAWVDAGRSTVDENPSLGDSFGRVSFYADGDYRLHVVSNAGVSLYDWDPVRITADTATMWENNQGTAYPPASTANQGQLFAKLDASSQLLSLGINDTGTRFFDIGAQLLASTYAGLPGSGADTAGALRRVTDQVRGIWMDTGAQWVNMTGHTVNVREFGAKGDGTTNDSAAFQAAAEALDALGGGKLYVPRGTYLLNGGVDTGFADWNQVNMGVCVGSNIHIQGEGPNASILKSTRVDVIFFTISNKTHLAHTDHHIAVSDLGFDRQTVAAFSGDGWNEAVYLRRVDYSWIQRCYYIGVVPATINGVKAFHVRGGSYTWITDNYVRDAGDNAIALNFDDNQVTHLPNGFGYIARNTCERTGVSEVIYSGIITTTNYTIIESNMVISTEAHPTGGIWDRHAFEFGTVEYVILRGNIVKDVGSFCAAYGNHVVITENYTDNGSIRIEIPSSDTTSFGNAYDINISNNLGAGNGAGINIQGRAYPLAAGSWDSANYPNATGQIYDVLIANNRFSGKNNSSQACIITNYAHGVQLIGNTITNCQYGGMSLNNTQNLTVAHNVVSRCGLAGSTGEGHAEGIHTHNKSTGVVMGNVCYDNARYGLSFAGPGNTDTNPYGDGTDTTGGIRVIDNVLWGNGGGTHYYSLAWRPTENTTNPFPLIRFTGEGQVLNNIRAGPGSIYVRTDPGSANDIMWIKYSGTDEFNWKAVQTVP